MSLLKQRNTRQAAWEVLCALVKHHRALSVSLTAEDAPLTKALCFGTCRHFFDLENALDQRVAKRPKSVEVWVLLVMGVYQLTYLNEPAYAVVNETVALLQDTRFAYAKGFVNGVLRQWVRSPVKPLPPETPLVQCFLEQQIQQAWPSQWPAILQANHQHAPMALRVNVSRISREAYIAQLAQQGIHATEHPFVSTAVLLTAPCDVTALPGFQAGWVSVQDVAAQGVASLLALSPGLRVLDACAAPGGKTGHLLEQEPQLKTCVAVDSDFQRLQRVKDTLMRLGVSATVLQGDSSHPEQWWTGEAFDRILVDAPCSGSGVVRRHPDINLLRTAEALQQSAAKQKLLLKALWPLLQPGGYLVYVTCSILPQENDTVIAHFLADTSDAECMPITLPWGHKRTHGWQVLPGEAEGDGFYYAVIRNTKERVCQKFSNG